MSYVKGVCEREKSSLVLLKLPGGNRSQLLLLPPAPQLVSDKLVSAFLSQLVRYLRVFTNCFPSSFHCSNNEDQSYPPLLHGAVPRAAGPGRWVCAGSAADPRWLCGTVTGQLRGEAEVG